MERPPLMACLFKSGSYECYLDPVANDVRVWRTWRTTTTDKKTGKKTTTLHEENFLLGKWNPSGPMAETAKLKIVNEITPLLSLKV